MENDFFFPPYKGEFYDDPKKSFFGNLKVMVVGNSHHCGDYDEKTRCGFHCPNFKESCRRFTKDVVVDFENNPTGKGLIRKDGDKDWRKTFTKFAWTFKYKCDRKYFFESIVFYNFLQRAVKDDKAQGYPEEIEISRQLVMDAIRERNPDIVILWGKENVLNHLPMHNWLPGHNNRMGYYILNGKKFKVVCIDHPVKAGYEKQRKILKECSPELIK